MVKDMIESQKDRSAARRFAGLAVAALLGVSGVLAACKSKEVPSPKAQEKAEEPKVQAPAAQAFAASADTRPRRHGHRPLALSSSAKGNCPDVVPGKLYRRFTGIDDCPVAMSPIEISNLNDPWAQRVLVPKAGGPDWPKDFDTIVNAARDALTNFKRTSYMLGEGSQIPVSEWPREQDRDLRFILTWGEDPNAPSVFFSARPPHPPSAETLEVIAVDSKTKRLNFYHFVGAREDSNLSTWVFAGDSSLARDPKTIGKECFACHLNGGLNMKELTSPWNNWGSVKAPISPDVVPPAVASSELFKDMGDAYDFEDVVEKENGALTVDWVASNVFDSAKIAHRLPELLRRLIVTTTINLASTEAKSAGQDAVAKLPPDFFLFDSALRDPSIGLTYDMPALAVGRGDYDAFLTANDVRMVNKDRKGQVNFNHPGATFFAFFVPTPAFEDKAAIQTLIARKVISPKFAAAVLMVDFQNPVFSPGRAGLMKYADQLGNGAADGSTIPKQFAALVDAAAKGQPKCEPARLAQCSAEQQFLYYWGQPDATWKTVVQARITEYLKAIQGRLATRPGAHDLLKLMISRGVQFSNYPLVCNLHEFDLLLPQTNLGSIFVQMNADGSISPQPAYACP